MKKRLLIICSIIGVLLVGFQFPIYAEETAPDYSSSTSIISSAALDQYFYDNYELLPYIESNNRQYINTNINASSNISTSLKFGGIQSSSLYQGLFGSHDADNSSRYYVILRSDSDINYFNFNISEISHIQNITNSYFVNNVVLANNSYLNNSLVYNFDSSFSSDLPIYLFSINNNGNPEMFTNYKLYHCSIYDYSANDGEGALVRDYYPARSKSGGVIGLYDAVTKTFVTTSGSVPFASPSGDPVNLSLGANITQFLSGSLSWIGAIFEGINKMPIIWVFIAIALAGVMFRWARRIVHF